MGEVWAVMVSLHFKFLEELDSTECSMWALERSDF